MGTYGRRLVGDKADHIIGLLNKALADEWLAHYQYWIGAKVIKGPMKESVSAELLQHAADEMRHAEMVADRIVQLGGTPVLHPKEWLEKTNCGYDAPEDAFVKNIIDQNVKGEQCAISVYDKLMKETREVDQITWEIAAEIIRDEVEHEEDLQALAEDFDLMINYNK